MRRVVSTVGLHGSASTWVFNVARELAVGAWGEAGVVSLYADEVARLPAPDGRAVVFKSHAGSAGLDAWLREQSATVLLSVRDPRDAAVSMATRFGAPLAAASRWIATDCARLGRLVAAGHPVFRYEDRFFDDPGAVRRMAALLDVTVTDEAADAVSERYRPDAVRRFAGALAELPVERVVRAGGTVFDDVTQIHATHMGDARSGKWRELPEAERLAVSSALRPFLAPLGYES